jgi:lipopolysaccharide/colanic/teichoic acid biosynthesis glycosyltransferase
MNSYRFFKRVADIIISLLAITIFFPVFVLIAISIVLTSPGAVIFKQQRAGKDGVLFDLYKFRTMCIDTPAYIPKPKEDDSRINKVGRFLRKCFLDETPQFFNVLKGQMSVVGPRPEMPFIVYGYTDKQKQRLKVKPGITGLWQLSAHTQEPIHDNLEWDLDYIKNQSPLLDLKILFRTVIAFFKMHNFALKNFIHD